VAVIEALDILRDGMAGLGLILKLPMPHQFILEGTNEKFHGLVVVGFIDERVTEKVSCSWGNL
jgi:hypothetical protein